MPVCSLQQRALQVGRARTQVMAAFLPASLPACLPAHPPACRLPVNLSDAPASSLAQILLCLPPLPPISLEATACLDALATYPPCITTATKLSTAIHSSCTSLSLTRLPHSSHPCPHLSPLCLPSLPPLSPPSVHWLAVLPATPGGLRRGAGSSRSSSWSRSRGRGRCSGCSRFSWCGGCSAGSLLVSVTSSGYSRSSSSSCSGSAVHCWSGSGSGRGCSSSGSSCGCGSGGRG